MDAAMKPLEIRIQDFPNQLTWQPVVENPGLPTEYEFVIAAGMGGSSAGAFLLRSANPSVPIILHRDYGLPPLPEAVLKRSIVITSSYSGNTEETIDAFSEAVRRNLPVACIATGGKLLEEARNKRVPFVAVPDTHIEPRNAVGFMVRAFLKVLGKDEELRNMELVPKKFSMDELEQEGKNLSEKLKGFFPIIYASTSNEAVAYNWKIRFNETAKIAAFSNVFPELTHNENMGFEFSGEQEKLGQPFAVVMLEDESDHPRVRLRMDLVADMYQKRNIPVVRQELMGETAWEKIFRSLYVCDWAAYYIGRAYGLDVEGEQTVTEFKKRMASKY